MITKGVSQEQKSPVLFSLPDIETNVGTGETETTMFNRVYDFTKIDYIWYSISAKMSSADPTGYVYVKIGGSLKVTHTITGDTLDNKEGRIDCTAITGKQALLVSYNTASTGADLIINGIYLTVVDA